MFDYRKHFIYLRHRQTTIININQHKVMSFNQFPHLKEYQTPDCAILHMEAQKLFCGSTYTVTFSSGLEEDENCTGDTFWK